MACPFEEQGVYSLDFKSHAQNRILLPSDQPQQMLLAWFPKLLNICCSCWFQRAVQKLSKSSASLNVRLAAWHPEVSCGTGRSTVGLMLAWDQLFHMWEERSAQSLWPNRQLMEEMQQWHKKMWCKLRQSSLQQAQWTPSGYIHGYMCYALELHMLTIPIYFFLL